jgi:peptidoglycan/LPS O-acetylase OafA/YrhL
MVLASHCAHTLGAPTNFGAPPFGILFQFGRAGADLFFVLSGFLISFIHWQDIGRPERLLHYAARRTTRIYPTYWLVLLMIVPVDLITHTLYDKYDQPIEILNNILLLPQSDPLIDVTWSLRNELVFYVLFGLAIFNRSLGAVVAALWIGLMAIGPYLAPNLDTNLWNLLTYPMNFEFVAGVAAGWAIQRITLPYPALILAAGIGVFSGFAVAEDLRLLWSHETHLWYPGFARNVILLRSAGYGIASVLIIAGLCALEMRRRIKAPWPLTMLGDASYLLYLIHVPALLILGASERHLHLLRFMPGWALASLFIIVIVGGAIILNRLVEKPLLRLIRPRRTATAVPA